MSVAGKLPQPAPKIVRKTRERKEEAMQELLLQEEGWHIPCVLRGGTSPVSSGVPGQPWELSLDSPSCFSDCKAWQCPSPQNSRGSIPMPSPQTTGIREENKPGKVFLNQLSCSVQGVTTGKAARTTELSLEKHNTTRNLNFRGC